MAMTDELFRRDSYLKECNAVVVTAHDGVIVTDQTVFYPEGGGQPGDTGWILRADGCEFVVTDTQKIGDAFLHFIKGKNIPEQGSKAQLQVDLAKRTATQRHHTATHLLHAALKKL